MLTGSPEGFVELATAAVIGDVRMRRSFGVPDLRPPPVHVDQNHLDDCSSCDD